MRQGARGHAARPNARHARGGRESVLSIHDPRCYTLSCNTCNLSHHPLSRAARRGAATRGAGGGVGGARGKCNETARIHSQVMNWNQPPRCHVYCLGSSMVRHCSWGQGRDTWGLAEPYREAYLWSPPWRRTADAPARALTCAACNVHGCGCVAVRGCVPSRCPRAHVIGRRALSLLLRG